MSDQEYFLDTFKNAATEVAQAIAKAQGIVATSFPASDPLRQEVNRFITSGGKRFRPALSLIVARSFGAHDVWPHLALETFHKYLLAHDDIIDRDAMRYGAPTIHAKMAQLKGKPDQHFGNSLAIIAGDLTEAATQRIILKSALPAPTKLALIDLVIQAVDEVAWGWYDQFLMDYLPLSSPELSLKRIEKSIIWVTGKYSTKLPLLFGFAVAGKNPPSGLEQFADSVGALFQTGDDIMGLFGKVEQTGKSNFGDISQGKKTLPMWFAYTQSSSADKKVLSHLVGKSGLTTSQAQTVRAIVQKSGGLQQAKASMSAYRQESLATLEQLELPADLKRFLRGLIFYLETRDR